MWHGYFVAERLTLNEDNWNQLISIFDGMGTDDSKFPAYNLQKRIRLDGNAVLYESQFNPGEVSGLSFRQMLANEFGVPVEQVVYETSTTNYSGLPDVQTTVWKYSYGGIDRFFVRRFGSGASWEDSRLETVGYLILYKNEWELE